MREYTVTYLFNTQPRTQTFELNQPELSDHDAALHLLALHLGDAENGLIMPPADAAPEQILAQAAIVGITRIQVA
ncbi:hypothetical protein VRC24_17475 [Pseudomonas poae]|uniref:hypothetical protein n=1 Tax=Pseudomonas poae TaxID=200451 RepID=UPI0030D473B6